MTSPQTSPSLTLCTVWFNALYTLGTSWPNHLVSCSIHFGLKTRPQDRHDHALPRKKDGETAKNHGKKSEPGEHQPHTSQDKQTSDDKGASKRRKAFITLSYIVVAYMICWVPFHFVFDVSLANPDIVPEDLYTAAFWMTYVNSGLNPFMYAFSSADFRSAVVQIINCRYCGSPM